MLFEIEMDLRLGLFALHSLFLLSFWTCLDPVFLLYIHQYQTNMYTDIHAHLSAVCNWSFPLTSVVALFISFSLDFFSARARRFCALWRER